jgi:hypothetical protein
MTIRCLTALLLFLTCCSGGDDRPSARSSPCPSTSPLADTSDLPPDLPVDEVSEVVEMRVRKGFLAAQGVTETSIVELYPQLSRALLDEGYEIISGDNEGFEAEIFFRRGRGTTGTYLLREGPCEGQVTLRLLYGSKRYRGAS